MNLQRSFQVLSYGWNHAGQINERVKDGEPSLIKGRIRIFFDILACYHKYSLWSNQYLKEKFYSLDSAEREEIGSHYKQDNVKKAEWTDYFYQNQKFFAKWSRQKYECSYKLSRKRNKAYAKRYNMGANCEVRQNVLLMSTHHRVGFLKIGDNCMFGRGCDIDYTGGLVIEKNVGVSEETIIMTHNHDTVYTKKRDHGCYDTPLTIRDRVWIGARSTIMPNVKEIGRGAVISACSCVRFKVPPYAIVMGNPAKVVGFRFPPKEIIELEKTRYPESERISIDVLENNYNKLFKNRIKDIKAFTKQ